eukprot:TRINITY_DN25039_c0_g1_i1.p1 TRINITY_DN25039_c0_g1~~TRINITY_DN25039_c0_g1_i1.p1  ORF type:complete len:250 (-),score=46.22 TRINITY_DN25039_c0_g1_i1:187-912(-)
MSNRSRSPQKQRTTGNRLKRLKLLHITKNAGTALEDWGKQQGCCWGKYWKAVQRHREALLPPHKGRLRSEWWHIPPRFFIENPYKDFDTFAVVRCPYARAISEFRCRWKGYCAPAGKDEARQQRRCKATARDLNDWLKKKLQTGAARPPFKNGHFIPQHLYIFTSSGGRSVVQVNVLRFERLQADFTELTRRYGFAGASALPHVNESEMPCFSVEDLEEETQKLIESEFEQDFTLLRYPRL